MSFKIIGIGEVLWDLLPAGAQLGGAPGNFAFHARALGAHASVVTRVGADDYGREILKRFKEQGIADGTVQLDNVAATGTVAVALSEAGIPNYIIHENVAWDRLVLTAAALKAVLNADAICFGTLAQRSEISRKTIQSLLTTASKDALLVLDINLRQNYYSQEVIESSLSLANVLKLNDTELGVLAGMFNLTGSTQNQIEQLAQKFRLRLIALTRGPGGSLLFQAGQWSDSPPVLTKVVDTVGAGDAFTAAMVMGLLQNMELYEINFLAGEVARHVCSCAGATPPLPKNICERFSACKGVVKKGDGLVAALKA